MFYHIISTENSKLLKIENIGFSSDPVNNKFGPGKRDLYLIHYVISGQGYFNGNPVASGQGFLIKPHTYEYYYPDTDDPWTFLWVTSQDTVMEDIFRTFAADENTQIFNYNYAADVRNLTCIIKQNHNKNYSSSKILEIFLNLFNRHASNTAVFKKNTDIYFEYAVNYIHTNVFRAIRVAEITDVLGITQPYLYKIFINKCGQSPKRYIDDYRLKIAKNMLLNSEMPVGTIGNSVGFDDPLVFSRFFKKNFGVSPSKFRIINNTEKPI